MLAQNRKKLRFLDQFVVHSKDDIDHMVMVMIDQDCIIIEEYQSQNILAAVIDICCSITESKYVHEQEREKCVDLNTKRKKMYSYVILTIKIASEVSRHPLLVDL